MTARYRESRSFSIEGHKVQVEVYYERRKNVRVALGRDKVLLRIPRRCSQRQRIKYNDWCDQWITDQWSKNPRFRATFLPFDVGSFSAFQVGDKNYTVEVRSGGSRPAVRLEAGTIRLSFPPSYDQAMCSATGYKLINKLLARVYQPVLLQKALELHETHVFSKPVLSLRLRNMSSKWGSCSHSGRLSLSTRLLFAPKEVRQYVLIHELCHLEELNHSKRFWQLVEGIMPAYAEQEAWLRSNGHLCDLKFAGIPESRGDDRPDVQLQLF